MTTTRRSAISMTAAGLIQVATHPETMAAAENTHPDLMLRQAKERGQTDLGWLKSYHSFSFGQYYDQRHMGFRSLRVINDDRIAPGRGFPTHPHRNMEIISYVLDGALQHKDSTGHGSVVSSHDIQMMSAGTGITHSEFNPSSESENHFLQIWIEPSLKNVNPRYHENRVTWAQKQDRWMKIAGPDGSKASVSVHADAEIYATVADRGATLDFTVENDRHAWLQVARGSLEINGTILKAGDAIATSVATSLHAKALEKTDALLFNLG